jgi:hypothetical protein
MASHPTPQAEPEALVERKKIREAFDLFDRDKKNQIVKEEIGVRFSTLRPVTYRYTLSKYCILSR